MLPVRLSAIMGMAASPQLIAEQYAALNPDYADIVYSDRDIEEMYEEAFEEKIVGHDPAIDELIKAIPQRADCEFGGYVVEDKLRYLKCEAENASVSDMPFTFHTHPLGGLCSDMPSETDIHSFLYHPRAVSLTLGTRKCWFFVKTNETLHAVERYFKWRDEHLIAAISAVCSTAESINDVVELKRFMLKNVFDFELPDTIDELENLDWAKLVEDKIAIKVLVAERA